jgi:hypothetical protein
MASRSPHLLSLATTTRAFSSSSSQPNGVSLVQGASRGIGLEFVRFYFSYKINVFFLLGISYIVKKIYFFSWV